MSLARLLLLIFVAGCVGVGAELLLIGHFEDGQQLIPIVLLALGVVGVMLESRGGEGGSRSFAPILLLMAVSGVVGQVLHFRGNLEFELERDATLGAWRLFAESMMGATPALAPGTMALLAAIGYAYRVARRHGR